MRIGKECGRLRGRLLSEYYGERERKREREGWRRGEWCGSEMKRGEFRDLEGRVGFWASEKDGERGQFFSVACE